MGRLAAGLNELKGIANRVHVDTENPLSAGAKNIMAKVLYTQWTVELRDEAQTWLVQLMMHPTYRSAHYYINSRNFMYRFLEIYDGSSETERTGRPRPRPGGDSAS